MARMIPNIPISTSSPGEIEIFNRLKAAPDDWVVFHSLDIARHRSQVTGEADFVVIIPLKGVLVVEVKAHKRVKFENGLWYLGNDSPSNKGPFKQAAGNMYALMESIKAYPSLKSVTVGKCVVFTEVNFKQISPEWNDWEVIDQNKLTLRPVTKLFSAVLDHWRGRIGISNSEPTPEQIHVLVNVFRPKFEYFVSPRVQLQRLYDEIKRYTEEQYGAIDSMSQNKRVLFVGPAGTGKTMLAIETAKRANAAGHKTLFLCFNRLLGTWLRNETEGLDLVKTATLHGYLREVADVKSVPDDADAMFWDDMTERAMERLVEEEFEPFNELVIDEAQDILLRPRYLDILDLVIKGGLSSGAWRIFGDFEGQAIYGHTDSISLDEVKGVWLPGVPVYSLRENCRNSLRVAELVHQLGGLTPGYRKILRGDDGNDPKILLYTSDEDQVIKLEDVLRVLDDDGFKRGEVVILSPKKSPNCAASKLPHSWKDKVKPLDAALPNRVRYTTIHSFKGLEAPCVIVTDLEDVASDLFYIAITRTLHRLFLLISESEKPRLLELLQARNREQL